MTADLHCKLHPKQITLKDILKLGQSAATARQAPDVSGATRGPVDDILSLSLTLLCHSTNKKHALPKRRVVLFMHRQCVSTT